MRLAVCNYVQRRGDTLSIGASFEQYDGNSGPSSDVADDGSPAEDKDPVLLGSKTRIAGTNKMTSEQAFFATAGLMITLFVAGLGFLKYYFDAKIEGVNVKIDGVNVKFDPIYKILERLDRRDESLNAYMVDHAERISKLESK